MIIRSGRARTQRNNKNGTFRIFRDVDSAKNLPVGIAGIAAIGESFGRRRFYRYCGSFEFVTIATGAGRHVIGAGWRECRCRWTALRLICGYRVGCARRRTTFIERRANVKWFRRPFRITIFGWVAILWWQLLRPTLVETVAGTVARVDMLTPDFLYFRNDCILFGGRIPTKRCIPIRTWFIFFRCQRIQKFENMHQTTNAKLYTLHKYRRIINKHGASTLIDWIMHLLTLAGGDVNGLPSKCKLTKFVMSRSSTGNVAIRLQLMSNDTKFKQVTSDRIKENIR